MKDNIDVLVTQFQQQMYAGFIKMLIEMEKLYNKKKEDSEDVKKMQQVKPKRQ